MIFLQGIGPDTTIEAKDNWCFIPPKDNMQSIIKSDTLQYTVKRIGKKIEAFGADVYVSYRKIKGIPNLLIYSTDKIGEIDGYKYLGIGKRTNYKHKSGYWEYDGELRCVKTFNKLEIPQKFEQFIVYKPKLTDSDFSPGIYRIQGPNRSGKTRYISGLLTNLPVEWQSFCNVQPLFTEKTQVASIDAMVCNYISDIDFKATEKKVSSVYKELSLRVEYLKGLKGVEDVKGTSDSALSLLSTDTLNDIKCIEEKCKSRIANSVEKSNKIKRQIRDSDHTYKPEKYEGISVDHCPDPKLYCKEVYTFLKETWDTRNLKTKEEYRRIEDQDIKLDYLLSIKTDKCDTLTQINKELEYRKFVDNTGILEDTLARFEEIKEFKDKLRRKEYQKEMCKDFNKLFKSKYSTVYTNVFGDNLTTNFLSGFEKTVKEIVYRICILEYLGVSLGICTIDEYLDRTHDSDKVKYLLGILSKHFNTVYYVTHFHNEGEMLQYLKK